MTVEIKDGPAPLIAPDVDLTDFAFMSLDVRRLRDSRIASVLSGEGFRCAVLLWCAAWHQKPAGSLPDDDMELSQLAGFGRALAEWKKVKAEALYGWMKCNDGRLYHPVVCEKANEAWVEKQTYRWRKECDRLRKLNLSRKEKGLDPLELPPNPLEKLSVSKGPTTEGEGKIDSGGGIPAENALKGKGQGQGQGLKEEKNAAPLRVAALADPDPPADSAAVVSTPEADLFRRGKEILGPSAGGLVRKLLTAKDGNIALARAAMETASTKGDPREYLGAMISGPGQSSRDLGGVRSSRDM